MYMHAEVGDDFKIVTQCLFRASIGMHMEIFVTHLKANNLWFSFRKQEAYY